MAALPTKKGNKMTVQAKLGTALWLDEEPRSAAAAWLREGAEGANASTALGAAAAAANTAPGAAAAAAAAATDEGYNPLEANSDATGEADDSPIPPPPPPPPMLAPPEELCPWAELLAPEPGPGEEANGEDQEPNPKCIAHSNSISHHLFCLHAGRVSHVCCVRCLKGRQPLGGTHVEDGAMPLPLQFLLRPAKGLPPRGQVLHVCVYPYVHASSVEKLLPLVFLC